MTDTHEHKSQVFLPQDVARLALEEVENLIKPGGGITFGLHSLEQRVRPLRPGKLAVIHGYTSNYKTGVMTWWARGLAHELLERDPAGECVIYVSWEDTVEDMGLYDLAHATRIDMTEILDGRINDAALERLKIAAFNRSSLPLWIIGDSTGQRKARERMTMSMIEDALAWAADRMQTHPVAMFFDYLNLIAPERKQSWGDNRRTDIMELTYRVRDLGLAHGCPPILGAQSNRQSCLRDWKLPQKWDILESSAVEQYADLILSLWLPSLTEPLSDEYDQSTWLKTPSGERLMVTDHLLLVGLNKQKRGPAGGWWPMYVDKATNEIGAWAQENDVIQPARRGDVDVSDSPYY